jgi:hypothetical protein
MLLSPIPTDSHNHSQPSVHNYMQLIQYNLKHEQINDDDNEEDTHILKCQFTFPTKLVVVILIHGACHAKVTKLHNPGSID